MIASNRKILTPYFLELLEEGNRDGSLHALSQSGDRGTAAAADQPVAAAVGVPGGQRGDTPEISVPGGYAGEMGVPLVDDSLRALIDAFIEEIPEMA